MGLAVFQAEPCALWHEMKNPAARNAPATPPREYSVYSFIIVKERTFVNRKT